MVRPAKAKSASKRAVPKRGEPKREDLILETSPVRYTSLSGNTETRIGPNAVTAILNILALPQVVRLNPMSEWGATFSKNALSESARAELVVDLYFVEEMMNVIRMVRRDEQATPFRKCIQTLSRQIANALEKWTGRLDSGDPLEARYTKLFLSWEGQGPVCLISPLSQMSAQFVKMAFCPDANNEDARINETYPAPAWSLMLGKKDNDSLELNLQPKDSEEEVPGYMERLIYLLTEYSPPKLAVAKYFNSYPFFLKANGQEPQGFSVYGSEDEAPCFPKGKECDKSSPKQPQPGLSLYDQDDEAPCFPRSKESETTPYALSINVMKSMLGRGSAEVFEKKDNTPKDAESTDVLKAKLLDEVITNTKNEPFPFGEGIVTDGLNELNDHYLGANSKNDKEEIEELKFEDRLVEHDVRFTPSPRREPVLFVVFATHPSIDQSRPNNGVQAVLDTIATSSVLEELSQNARNNLQYLEGIVKDEPFPFGFELVDGAVGHLQEGYNGNARALSTRWSHNEQQRASAYRNHRRRMAAVQAQMLPSSLRNRGKGKEASQNQLSEKPKEEVPVKTEEELAREAKEREVPVKTEEELACEAKEREAHEAGEALRRQLKKQRQKERKELAKQEQAREKMLLDEEKAKKDAERLAKREAVAAAEADSKRHKEEQEALAKAKKDQEELDKKAEEEKLMASPTKFTPFKASLNPPSESESPVIIAPAEPKEVPKTSVLRPIRPALPVAKSFAQKPKANIPVGVGKKESVAPVAQPLEKEVAKPAVAEVPEQPQQLACPVCNQVVPSGDPFIFNQHLDYCLSKQQEQKDEEDRVAKLAQKQADKAALVAKERQEKEELEAKEREWNATATVVTQQKKTPERPVMPRSMTVPKAANVPVTGPRAATLSVRGVSPTSSRGVSPSTIRGSIPITGRVRPGSPTYSNVVAISTNCKSSDASVKTDSPGTLSAVKKAVSGESLVAVPRGRSPNVSVWRSPNVHQLNENQKETPARTSASRSPAAPWEPVTTKKVETKADELWPVLRQYSPKNGSEKGSPKALEDFKVKKGEKPLPLTAAVTPASTGTPSSSVIPPSTTVTPSSTALSINAGIGPTSPVSTVETRTQMMPKPIPPKALTMPPPLPLAAVSPATGPSSEGMQPVKNQENSVNKLPPFNNPEKHNEVPRPVVETSATVRRFGPGARPPAPFPPNRRENQQMAPGDPRRSRAQMDTIFGKPEPKPLYPSGPARLRPPPFNGQRENGPIRLDQARTTGPRPAPGNQYQEQPISMAPRPRHVWADRPGQFQMGTIGKRPDTREFGYRGRPDSRHGGWGRNSGRSVAPDPWTHNEEERRSLPPETRKPPQWPSEGESKEELDFAAKPDSAASVVETPVAEEGNDVAAKAESAPSLPETSAPEEKPATANENVNIPIRSVFVPGPPFVESLYPIPKKWDPSQGPLVLSSEWYTDKTVAASRTPQPSLTIQGPVDVARAEKIALFDMGAFRHHRRALNAGPRHFGGATKPMFGNAQHTECSGWPVFEESPLKPQPMMRPASAGARYRAAWKPDASDVQHEAQYRDQVQKFLPTVYQKPCPPDQKVIATAPVLKKPLGQRQPVQVPPQTASPNTGLPENIRSRLRDSVFECKGPLPPRENKPQHLHREQPSTQTVQSPPPEMPEHIRSRLDSSLFKYKGPLPPRENRPVLPINAVQSQPNTAGAKPAIPQHMRARLEGTLMQCKGPLPPRGSMPESPTDKWIPSLTLQYGGSIEPIVFPQGYVARHGMQDYLRGDYKSEFRVPDHPFKMKQGEEPCCKKTEFEMPPKASQESRPPKDEKGKAPEQLIKKLDTPLTESEPLLPSAMEQPRLQTPTAQQVPSLGHPGSSSPIRQPMVMIAQEIPNRPSKGIQDFYAKASTAKEDNLSVPLPSLAMKQPRIPTPTIQVAHPPGNQGPSNHIGQKMALVTQEIPKRHGKGTQEFNAKSPAVDEDNPSISMKGSYFRPTTADIRVLSSMPADHRPPVQPSLQDFYMRPAGSAQVSPSSSDATVRPPPQQQRTKWRYGQPVKYGGFTYYINPMTGLYPDGVQLPNARDSYRAPNRQPGAKKKSDYGGNGTQGHASGSHAPQQHGGRPLQYRQSPQPVVYVEIPKPQGQTDERMHRPGHRNRGFYKPQSNH